MTPTGPETDYSDDPVEQNGSPISKFSRCQLSCLAKSLVRWDALSRYTADGRLDICNNAAGRAMHPLATGRKNWTFAGSDSGGALAAVMYTIIEAAKLIGMGPEAYLRTVIARLSDHLAKRLAELLPWNIKL